MTKATADINCLVVDDEPLALALLSDYVGKVPGLHLHTATSDPLKALELIKTDQIGLVFLDMQMPELSGVQFLKILQRRCLVIITTAYSEYALEGYEHHVVDYLLKPITLDRFMIAAEKAMERLAEKPSPANTVPPLPIPGHIFVKTEYRIVKIDLDDIYYLEGARDYVVIHTKTEQVITLQSLSSLEASLPEELFIRVHRSYVIALNSISFIERGRIAINDQLIPVGDTYKDKLFARLKL